jgi:protein-L-isoaspartate O-methyltransferase
MTIEITPQALHQLLQDDQAAARLQLVDVRRQEEVAVERDVGMRDQASTLVKKLGGCKSKFLDSLPQTGFDDYDGYDVIFLNGAVASPPLHDSDGNYGDRLREGGRLLLIVRDVEGAQQGSIGTAYVYRKQHGQLSRLALFDCATPWLPGFAPPHRFVF